MKFGTGRFYYMEARDDGVLMYTEDVNLIGSNYVNELLVPYSEIMGVRFIDGGGFLPMIALILDVRGKNYPMNLKEPSPYKIQVVGGKYREPALQMKQYIEDKLNELKDNEKFAYKIPPYKIPRR